MRAKIKKILSKPAWGGKAKGFATGAVQEENLRLKAEIKDRRDETARLKVALRACWKICRDGQDGEAVTKVVIDALGARRARAGIRTKQRQGADKEGDG